MTLHDVLYIHKTRTILKENSEEISGPKREEATRNGDNYIMQRFT